jgi:hypothetical protein
MSGLKSFRRVDFSKTDTIGPGEYAMVVLDGVSVPVVGCPGCGRRTYMLDHAIDSQGCVTPSVGCSKKGCDYHEVGVVLEDWVP